MLSVAYLRQSVYHRGRRVSRAHAIVLTAYEQTHHTFLYINQGRRTIAEQWGFWNHYKQYGYPLAAYPSPAAPHIKYNQANHAMDINAPAPAYSVAAFYRSQGISVAFNVSTEAWHMDTLSEQELLTVARKLVHAASGPPTLKVGSRGKWVSRLQNRLRQLNVDGAPKTSGYFGPKTRAAVIHYQRKKKIQPTGVCGPRTWASLLRRNQ